MTTDADLKSRLTALTRDLILIPSTESRPDERRRCFEFIGNHIEALEGTNVRMYECNGHESLVALPQSIDCPDILLCGHIDVIDHPENDCFHSEIRDGRIYGPGSGDMKGADAILLELFRSLHAERPGLSLGLALTSDEERGGADGVRFLVDEVGLRAAAVVVPDGGSLTEVTEEEKGVLQLVVRRHGHEAHAARPWLGVNAIELLADRLTAVRGHFAKYWPDEDVQEQKNHWFPTCSTTIVSTPNQTPNRIPAEAQAVLDIRFPPPYTVDTMRQEVDAILGPDCDTETLMTAEPSHLDPDPLFCEITSELTGTPTTRVRASGASDSRFFREHGIPVNLSRPLVGNLHAVDEWIDINSMVTWYRICERYLKEKLPHSSGDPSYVI